MSIFHQPVLRLYVPSTLVVPQKVPPPPPPVPGTVKPEDLRPPVDPPRPFLRPMKRFEEVEQTTAGTSLPVQIDETELAAFNERHDVRHTLEVVFKDRSNKDEIVDDVLNSLASPFKMSDSSSIVWSFVQAVKQNPDRDAKLGGKKLVRRHKILQGPAWSIVSFGDSGTGVRRNMIYDGDGVAIAQVDFGHGTTIGIHVHALVVDNLAHTPGYSEDHCFELESVPWPWMCIPDVRESENVERCGVEYAALPTILDMTRDGMRWIPVAMPYEDFLGERAFSEEW